MFRFKKKTFIFSTFTTRKKLLKTAQGSRRATRLEPHSLPLLLLLLIVVVVVLLLLLPLLLLLLSWLVGW